MPPRAWAMGTNKYIRLQAAIRCRTGARKAACRRRMSPTPAKCHPPWGALYLGPQNGEWVGQDESQDEQIEPQHASLWIYLESRPHEPQLGTRLKKASREGMSRRHRAPTVDSEYGALDGGGACQCTIVNHIETGQEEQEHSTPKHIKVLSFRALPNYDTKGGLGS